MRQAVATVVMLFGLALGLHGAEDVQLWEVFGIDWKPVRGLKLELEKQLRYENTLSGMESDHTELGISYKISSWLELQADYRFIGLGDEKRNRVDGNIVLGWKGKAIAISNRARIQKELIENPGGRYSELVFRDRLQVTFRAGQSLRPYVGGEIFQGLDEPGKTENKYRLTGGFDYDMTKRVTLSLYYHFQHDLGEATNETAHILAARFRYSF